MTYIQTLLDYAKQFVTHCRSGMSSIEEAQYELSHKAEEISVRVMETQARVSEIVDENQNKVEENHISEESITSDDEIKRVDYSQIEALSEDAITTPTQWAPVPEDLVSEDNLWSNEQD